MPVALVRPDEVEVTGVTGVAQVRHREGVDGEDELDRAHHGCVLGEHRCGRAVGQRHAVADEAAIVEFLGEVAAVGEVGRAVGGVGEQAVVAPLPDEAAVDDRVRVDHRLVAVDTAGAVAHGVHVLAHDHGAVEQLRRRAVDARPVVADAGGQVLELLDRRVHPRIEVGVGTGVVALVVHRTARVAPVDPFAHRGEVHPRPGFVAQRPGNDARVVLVALDHALDPVEVAVAPSRVVTGVAHPVEHAEAVGLDVALVDHPEAELVGKVEQGGVWRVVAGADRVQVSPLHQHQVAAGLFCVEHPATGAVELVTVHPAQPQPAAVHEPGVAVDPDPTEPDPHRHGLRCVEHLDVVATRNVGAPRLHRANVDAVGGPVQRGIEAEVCTGDPNGVAAANLGKQGTAPRGGVVVGAQPHVVQSGRRARKQGDLAEDARQPPLVLVLDVAHRRPLVDPHVQQVLAHPEFRRDIEFLRQAAAPDDAHLDAVEVHDRDRIHPGEAQHRTATVGHEPVRNVEAPPVVAGRVGVRHERRLDREREDNVGVDR